MAKTLPFKTSEMALPTTNDNRQDNHTEINCLLRPDKTDGRSLLRKATDLYFAPKPIEKWEDGRIYEYLGVKYMKKMVMETTGSLMRAFGADKETNTYFIGKRPTLDALKKFESLTRWSESIHIPASIIAGYSTAQLLSENRYEPAILTSAIFLINTSVVILQRYNRAKVYNVIARKEEKVQSSQ